MKIVKHTALMIIVFWFLVCPFSIGTIQADTTDEESKWLVWGNDVGYLHVGTVKTFKRTKPRSSEPGGGTSDTPVVKTQLLGPFETKAKALDALDTQITEVEERTYRNSPYLVVKFGGKEYRLASEVKLKRIPIARFPAQYLIHITKTYTTSGPVEKDSYVMHHEPPKEGKFKTADGYGGTFTNEGTLVDGPFKTNFELCPKLRNLNLKGISLCSPYGRWISCTDPRWAEASTTPSPELDVGTTEPVEPSEEETEATTRLTVELILEDNDDQLTPADEALLRFKIKNTSPSATLTSLRAKLEFKGEIKTHQAIWFLDATDPCRMERSDDSKLGPGATWQFDARIRTAAERNKWIFNNLIKGVSNENAKPKPEKNIALKDVIQIEITGKVEGSNANQAQPSTLLQTSLSAKQGQAIAQLVYPDLTTAAGQPDASAEKSIYYRNGDKNWTFAGNELVRAIALRGARFGGSKAALLDYRKPYADEKQLADKGDEIADSPLFPENDTRQVVINLVEYVHQSLMPKKAPNDATTAKGLTKRLWNGWCGPGRPIANHTFICQEHSLLLGAMLRALGFSVREVNILTMPFLGRTFIGLFQGRIIRSHQDAATEVYFDRKWHFYGLFKTSHYFTDHRTHYAHWVQAYEMWRGAASWQGGETRFHMTSWKMHNSKEWEFIGYGDNENFRPAKSPPWLSWVAPFITYEWRSPIAAMIVLPDGRTIGTNTNVSEKQMGRFLMDDEAAPFGVQNNVKGAYYFPEGLTLYSIASDPASKNIVDQSIVIPVQNSDEYKQHRIILSGIGNGSYRMLVTYQEPNKKALLFEEKSGTITTGQTVTINGADLALRVPPRDVDFVKGSPVPTPDQKEKYQVDVSVDWVADELVTVIQSQDFSSTSKDEIPYQLRLAALPDMLTLLRSIYVSSELTFGEAVLDYPELSEKVTEVLLKAPVVSVKHHKNGDILYRLRLSLGELRATLPKNKFP